MPTDGKAWSTQLIYWFEWQEVNPSEKTRCSIAAMYRTMTGVCAGGIYYLYLYITLILQYYNVCSRTAYVKRLDLGDKICCVRGWRCSIVVHLKN